MKTLRLPTDQSTPDKGTVIVWGLLSAYPFGGMIWQVLHYVAGFRDLGYDVWYIEDSDRSWMNPHTWGEALSEADHSEFMNSLFSWVGLEARWACRVPRTDRFIGALSSEKDLAATYGQAEFAFNLCGAQEWRPDHAVIPKRVYLETDPAVSQVAVAEGDASWIRPLDTYHYHFTYAENLYAADCLLPQGRYNWGVTRPPVIPRWWRRGMEGPHAPRLTTIANWNTTGTDIQLNGQLYRWRKSDEFRKYRHLPAVSPLTLAMAVVGMDDLEQQLMKGHGWHLSSGRDLSDAWDYHRFVTHSAGEFTVSKEQYVYSRSGWFSDRSVCYLAAGLPVITQDTAFSKWLPVGKGLLTFSNADEALQAIASVAADPAGHQHAAREIALDYFDAATVVARLMHDVASAEPFPARHHA